MQLKIQQSYAEAPEIWAQREHAVTHIHTVSYKTVLVTLANAQSVLLKEQGSRYNNEPSGPSSSSSPETQTLLHLQPGVYKGEERERDGGRGERDYLHLKTCFGNADV